MSPMHVYSWAGSSDHCSKSDCDILELLESLCFRICFSVLTSPDTASLGDMVSCSRGAVVKNAPGKKSISPFSSPVKLRILSQTVYLMNIIHRMVCEDRKVTQRELFYRSLSDNHGPGFPEQASLNKALISLTDALGCDRHELGVFTTARGLVAGDPSQQTLCLDEMGEFVADLSAHQEGLNISESIASGVHTIATSAKLVLIVEKDTVFQSLVNCSGFFESVSCILVTARGYPDNATVRFLQRLSRLLAGKLPFLYLGDLDPHGISIFMTYYRTVGSWIEWLGLKHEDLDLLDNQSSLGLKLKATDCSLLNSLIEKDSTPDYVKIELARIERRGLKYEVECLHSAGEFFLAQRWLPLKLSSFIN